jgi:hypothetical protein
VTDTQELTAPDAPARHPIRWLSVTSAAFALAIVLGGTDLMNAVSASGGRIVVIVALTMAFLLFALVGAGILPSRSNQPAIAGIGVVMLSVALAVSWSAVGDLPGPAQVRTSNDTICGDITSMDHDFVAITEQERESGPDGQQKVTSVQRLVPVAAIVFIAGVDKC